MKRLVKLTVLFLCLCVAVPAAHSQGKCSLQTLVGTYAIYEKGSSLIMDPSLQPFPLHWAPAFAPFANVAEITFTPAGVGDGFYWIFVGSLNAGLTPIPVHVTITEMKPDCTGKMQYQVALPGIPSATIEERLLVLDNGREFRSVPTSIENGVPTLAWIGTGRRISKSSKPVNSCGPQTAHGTYMLTCESIDVLDPNNPNMYFANSLLFRVDISLTGDFTGTLYEKAGPASIEIPVSGTVNVNSDCSFSSTLNTPLPGTNHERGVFLDQGKEFYMLPIVTEGPGPNDQKPEKYAFCQGKRIGQ